jgi:adenylate kinase family enzyme
LTQDDRESLLKAVLAIPVIAAKANSETFLREFLANLGVQFWERVASMSSAEQAYLTWQQWNSSRSLTWDDSPIWVHANQPDLLLCAYCGCVPSAKGLDTSLRCVDCADVFTFENMFKGKLFDSKKPQIERASRKKQSSHARAWTDEEMAQSIVVSGARDATLNGIYEAKGTCNGKTMYKHQNCDVFVKVLYDDFWGIAKNSDPSNRDYASYGKEKSAVHPSVTRDWNNESALKIAVFDATYVCPSQHPLSEFVTPNNRFQCDACESKIAKKVTVHRCSTCNFDLCQACWNLRKNPAEPEETSTQQVDTASEQQFLSDSKTQAPFMVVVSSRIGVRSGAAYPGERTGGVVDANVVCDRVVAIQHTKDDISYIIKFFHLKDGSGWIHDFHPSHPDVPNCSPLVMDIPAPVCVTGPIPAVNGKYAPTDLYNRHMLYQHVENQDLWLRYCRNDKWALSHTQDKIANNNNAVAFCDNAFIAHPFEGKIWKRAVGPDFETLDTVRVVQEEAVTDSFNSSDFVDRKHPDTKRARQAPKLYAALQETTAFVGAAVSVMPPEVTDDWLGPGRLLGFKFSSASGGDTTNLNNGQCRIQFDRETAPRVGSMQFVRVVSKFWILAAGYRRLYTCPSAARTDWTCSSCQASNRRESALCTVCLVKAPKWKCSGCTALNNPTREFCQACRNPVNQALVPVAGSASPPKLDPNVFHEGEQLEGNYRNNGTWYRCTITTTHADSTYDLRYYDGCTETHIKPDKLRRPGGKTASPAGVKRCTVSDYLRGMVNVDQNDCQQAACALERLKLIPVARTSRGQRNEAKSFQIGDALKAYFKGAKNGGRIYDATIIAVNSDGSYDLKYSDNDVEKNTRPETHFVGQQPKSSDLWGCLDEEEAEESSDESMPLEDHDTELEKNLRLGEAYFHGLAAAEVEQSNTDSSDIGTGSPFTRQDSAGFFQMNYYEPIMQMSELVSFADKAGNSAAHHAAIMKLKRAAEALIEAGSNKWRKNLQGDTPAGLLAGLSLGAGPRLNQLYRAISIRGLVPASLTTCALDTAETFTRASSAELEDAIQRLDEKEAQLLIEDLEPEPDLALYRALLNIQFGFGAIAATQDLQAYLSNLELQLKTAQDAKDSKEEAVSTCLHPLFYFVSYLIWKHSPGKTHSKSHRLLAADALRAFRCFPAMAAKWLTPDDNEDESVIMDGLDSDAPPADDEDDYADLFAPVGPDDPESVWSTAKADYDLVSPAMDQLMGLVGLRSVKETAVSVVLSVLLEPPADLKSTTSMNFTFVGNPGCGKTTVATLLSQAMVEVGVRQNATPVITSATDILGEDRPLDAFAKSVKDALNGTLFIDEAHQFDPAPRGQRANDSSKVLNYLLKASEQFRHNTTFILAGYPEEIQTLLSYDLGFQGRFPKIFTFAFEDYSEIQLTKILNDMARARGYIFENQRECGVPIARVLARRDHRGAGSRGFANARLCEKRLDLCVLAQKARLLKLKLHKVTLTDRDYRLLTRVDCLGPRPNLEENEHYRELMAMHGLASVKRSVRNLVTLQLQNYDAEMRGDRVQTISLHRIFLGNAGTGKTTVASLLGKMLHAFGFLSDGGVICRTPADLTGSSVGEAAARTKALLDSAKGKVIFIDEAYNLDPMRNQTGASYGAEVIDTLVEKIQADAGADMCVILAGYKPQMEQLFRNSNNPVCLMDDLVDKWMHKCVMNRVRVLNGVSISMKRFTLKTFLMMIFVMF